MQRPSSLVKCRANTHSATWCSSGDDGHLVVVSGATVGCAVLRGALAATLDVVAPHVACPKQSSRMAPHKRHSQEQREDEESAGTHRQHGYVHGTQAPTG